MKGRNTVELNEATMCDIVQHYFNTVLFSRAPTVESINTRKDSFSTIFIVTTMDPPEPPTPVVNE